MIKGRILNARFRQISSRFKSSTCGFNTKAIDLEIARIADKLYAAHQNAFNSIGQERGGIGAIATTIYDSGGHTACLLNFAKSFGTETPIDCFLTRPIKEAQQNAPENLATLSRYATIHGSRFQKREYSKSIIDLFNRIATQNLSVLFVYTHPKDIVAAATVHLLRKIMGLKVAFVNLSDHFPCTGMMFADRIIDARPAGFNLTRNERGYDNNLIIDLQSVPTNENISYSDETIHAEREKIGAPLNSLISVSGCAAYKIFDSPMHSSYFELIRDLLVAEPRLIHVLVTKLNPEQNETISKIFAVNPEARMRLKIAPFRPDFSVLLQVADLFIDSFPQGSALSHIDCMRARCPTVIKINQDYPFKSFESYLPEDYPYKYMTPDDMKNGVLSLLQAENLRVETGNVLYQCYLNRFEFHKVKIDYQKVIEGLIHEDR